MREEERPSLIRVTSIIGWRSPNKRARARRTARRSARTRCARPRRCSAGIPTRTSSSPTRSTSTCDRRARGAAAQAEWERALRGLARRRTPSSRAEWDRAWAGKPLPGLRDALPELRLGEGQARHALGRRARSMAAVRAVRADDGRRRRRPQRVDEDRVRRRRAHYTQERAGRNVFFGVREHGMGGAVNGMALHGGIVRPYGSTFLQFADYMRGSIRLSALMRLARRLGLHARLGRPRRGRPDAPAGRAPRRAARDPGPDGDPPGRRQRDGRGVARRSSRTSTGPRPRALAPGPADRSTARRSTSPAPRAAPTCSRDGDRPEVAIVGTGSEVSVALGAAELLAEEGVARARRLDAVAGSCSRPQDDAYRDAVLPPGAADASRSRPASRWAGSAGSTASVGDRPLRRHRAGRRGPGEARDHRAEHVAEAAKELLG